MTMFFGPGAAGSGVAEAMGYLNGVVYPDYCTIPVLITKFCGVILAVAAGMCAGKEGPLVHLGFLVGVAVIYLPFNIFKYFRNDTDKRIFSVIGICTGISVAFGAPIGGSLFGYELSQPNTFWSFHLTWRVFFGTCVSTFTLNILTAIREG